MSMDNIEHVVVLMLENRSFDSMLGWLYENEQDAADIHNIPELPKDLDPPDKFRGLQDVCLEDFRNTDDRGGLGLSEIPTRGARGFTTPTVDPGERFENVLTQFYGPELDTGGPVPNPGPDVKVTMTGVLADFVDELKNNGYDAQDIKHLANMCLESFTPGQLPVLSQLAKHYAVSDDWFASVPSQTNPNRAFLMCATSTGMVNNGDIEDANDPVAREINDVLKMKIGGDDKVDAPTIFNALHDAGVDWSVFWQTSYLPEKIFTLLTDLPKLIPIIREINNTAADLAQAILDELSEYTDYLEGLTSGELESCYTWRLFPHIKDNIPDAAEHFSKLDDFHRRARSGELPAFSYIEPFWTISATTNDNSAKGKLYSALGNDYHPPSNVLVGEEFVKDVYTSLIANKDAWAKTMLLITFDEFVGTFDHQTDSLKSGTVVPPWEPDNPPKLKIPHDFEFNRLGARVPTIVVSPYVNKQTVFRSDTSAPYDHSSVIATTLNWLDQSGQLENFGRRAQAAPTFEKIFTLDQPRTDENALAFLDRPREQGELIQFGDAFLLRNQNGEYLTTFEASTKHGDFDIPDSLIDLAVDFDVAAYFPTVGRGGPAVLTFRTQSPDPADQIDHGTNVLIVCRAQGLGPRNLLGAWADSHDCYYADEYIDGDDAAKEHWIVRKVSEPLKPLHYGDQIHLENSFYTGQGLTRDVRPLLESGWITTNATSDSWTLEPAPMDLLTGAGQGTP